MALSETEIIKAVRDFVLKAKANNKLSETTPRVIRKQVEKHLSLEPGALDEYKTLVSVTAKEAATEEDDAGNDVAVAPAVSSSSATRFEVSGKQNPPNQSDSELSILEDSKSVKRKLKKRRIESTDKKEKPDKLTSAPRLPLQTAKAKAPKSLNSPQQSSKTRRSIGSDSEKVPKMDDAAVKSESEMSVLIDSRPSKKPKIQNDVKGKSKQVDESISVAVADQSPRDDTEKSESELSVLIDSGPVKKRKGQKETKGNETKPKKQDKQPLDKDEEAVKKLKSLVLACGVRKMWSKEFKDLPTPKLQISRLRTILSELGMTGRLSLEQAKSIKAKREFAQEMKDIISFEKEKGVNAAGRSRRSRKSAPTESDDDNDGDGDRSAPVTASKSKASSARSILSFLGDQSSDQE